LSRGGAKGNVFCDPMQLDIPTGDFAGYIFDLDGTLIDSMPVHYRAWDLALRRFGLREKLDEDMFYGLGGVPTYRVAELLGHHYGLTLDLAKVEEAKEGLYSEELAGVKVIEPVAAFARRVAALHPVAIVTGGTPDVVGPALAAAKLDHLFSIIITPRDVPIGRAKPEPDMYLLAAERMGVPPAGVLVFEDAEPGLVGARAAGMQVVHVQSRRR
jgi:HAD superfamily hydrolase (TIGR01509 family)